MLNADLQKLIRGRDLTKTHFAVLTPDSYVSKGSHPTLADLTDIRLGYVLRARLVRETPVPYSVSTRIYQAAGASTLPQTLTGAWGAVYSHTENIADMVNRYRLAAESTERTKVYAFALVDEQGNDVGVITLKPTHVIGLWEPAVKESQERVAAQVAAEAVANARRTKLNAAEAEMERVAGQRKESIYARLRELLGTPTVDISIWAETNWDDEASRPVATLKGQVAIDVKSFTRLLAMIQQ